MMKLQFGAAKFESRRRRPRRGGQNPIIALVLFDPIAWCVIIINFNLKKKKMKKESECYFVFVDGKKKKKKCAKKATKDILCETAKVKVTTKGNL